MVVGYVSIHVLTRDDHKPPYIAIRAKQTIAAENVFHMAWSPDGRSLVTAMGGGGEYSIWDVTSGKKIRSLDEPYGPWVAHGPFVFTPDGHHVLVTPKGVLTADDGKRVIFALWNVETGNVDRQILQPAEDYLTAHDFALAPSAHRLAVAYGGTSTSKRVVVVYDTRTWRIINTKVPLLAPYGGGFAISPDGNRIAMGGGDGKIYRGQARGTIWIYDIAAGQLLRTIEGAHADRIRELAFDPTGTMLASAAPVGARQRNEETDLLDTFREDDPIRLWSVETGDKLAFLTGSFRSSYTLSFNNSRPLLISGDLNGVKGDSFFYRLWDTRSGQLLATSENFSRTAPVAVAFSPDGGRIALSINFNRVLILDLGNFGLN